MHNDGIGRSAEQERHRISQVQVHPGPSGTIRAKSAWVFLVHTGARVPVRMRPCSALSVNMVERPDKRSTTGPNTMLYMYQKERDSLAGSPPTALPTAGPELRKVQCTVNEVRM